MKKCLNNSSRFVKDPSRQVEIISSCANFRRCIKWSSFVRLAATFDIVVRIPLDFGEGHVEVNCPKNYRHNSTLISKTIEACLKEETTAQSMPSTDHCSLQIVFTKDKYRWIVKNKNIFIKLKEELDVDASMVETDDSYIASLHGHYTRCLEAERRLLCSLIFVVVDMSIPFRKHSQLIGRGGVEINKIRDRFRVSITVPPRGEMSDIVHVAGSSIDRVEQAMQAITELIAVKDEQWREKMAQQVTLQIAVPSHMRGLLIGAKGETVGRLRSQHGVKIKIADDLLTETVVIQGRECDCQAVVRDISAIVGTAQFFEVQVPYVPAAYRKFRSVISSAQLQSISADFKVKVNNVFHDDQSVAKLIVTADEGCGATKDDCRRATDALLQLWPVVGRVQVSPKHFSRIVGKGGATIREMRSKFHVSIQVPVKQTVSRDVPNFVTIIGLRDNVAQAEKHLADLISATNKETEIIIVPRRDI